MRFYAREFVFVGILGAFTTFSTFGLDILTLARTGALQAAAWNVVAHVGVGLIAVSLGFALGERL